MRKLIRTLCVAVLLVGGLTLTARAAEKEKKTVEGELVDMHCYAKGDAQGEGHAKCGQGCAKSGIPVGVLSDGKALTLTTNPKPLADAVGKTVRVAGEVNMATMTIAPEKVEVKDGENWKEIKMEDAHHK